MKHTERVAPVAAALSALTTVVCCLPIGIAAAAATASIGAVVASVRPWLLAMSVVLLGVGVMQLYRRNGACARQSRTSVALFWTSAAIVVVALLFPQLLASVLAN